MTELQRTEDWYNDRVGKVTASRIGDVMAKTKTGVSASRKNYASQLVCEIMTGKREEGFQSAAMLHGIETEKEARKEYELETFNIVEECGFIQAPDIERSGASPDGLIGVEGVLEIKCPNTATHIETMLTGVIDIKYIYQIQWQMYCSGRKWCHFVSYDNRMPEGLRIYIIYVERDDKMIETIKSEVIKLIEEVEETVKKLSERLKR